MKNVRQLIEQVVNGADPQNVISLSACRDTINESNVLDDNDVFKQIFGTDAPTEKERLLAKLKVKFDARNRANKHLSDLVDEMQRTQKNYEEYMKRYSEYIGTPKEQSFADQIVKRLAEYNEAVKAWDAYMRSAEYQAIYDRFKR